MLLSHPASVFKLANKNELPRCTNAEAVKYILKSTVENEKIIIFSLYKDVLNAYYDLCLELGYKAIKITGEDKGNEFESKLTLFKHSKSINILLTTLQKSSEGLNLDIATHVIILEFWLNPHKLFQAMFRIDRKTQKRNIFMYLLCYNYNGKVIRIENIYYKVIIDKINQSNDVYTKINEYQINNIGGKQS
jgi:SNF2 family DNA or RNA helicase